MNRFEQNSSLRLHVAILASTAAVLAAELFTPLGIAVWILYLGPLSLSLFVWKPRTPVLVAALATVLILLGYRFDTGGMDPWMARVNRTLGVVTVWGVAIICRQSILNKIAVQTRDWLRQGQALLAVRMQGNQDVSSLGDNGLRFLSEYLGAQVGAIYVATQDGSFERSAAYALGHGELSARATLAPGEGLAGQVMKDRRVLHLRDIPDDAPAVSSATFAVRPKHLVIAPMVADDEVNAIVELGFLHPVSSSDLELLSIIAEPVGIAIRSSKYRTRLRELLEETQRQTEELQAQQEELRASNEELEENGRALRESQGRLEQQQYELEQTNTQLQQQTEELEAQKDDLIRAQRELTNKAKELERTSRYKSEFLANMSHELRTPLNSTLIFAKLLSDNKAGNLTAEQVKFAQTICSAGNDLLTLINDILDLSKIEAGKVEITPEPIVVSRMLTALSTRFQPLAAQNGVEFVSIAEDGLPRSIETDSQRLQQILNNLLSNAFKFTDAGSVTLRAFPAGDGLVGFAVRDTGIGIDAHQQEVIFEAFRQADGTTNRKYGGTGLGLSISRDLARLLGGRISVSSTPGQGSTFTLVLPTRCEAPSTAVPATAEVAARQAAASAATAAAPAALASPPPPAASALPAAAAPAFDDDRLGLNAGSRLILVIEDDPAFARLLVDLAHEREFQCLVAQSADEGVAMAERYSPSAILLDIGLPDRSGLSVLDRLKRWPATRHIPVHIISAHDYTDTALSMGAVGYALKPVNRERLVEAFDRLDAKAEQQLRRVLIVEDDDVQRESMSLLLGGRDVEIVGVGTAAEALMQLKELTFDCMVLDLSLADASGYELLERMTEEAIYSFPPVIVYTGRSLTRDEEHRLRRYSKSIIIKGAKSPERLLDEVTLFLHQVESSLSPDRQRMLREVRDREAVFEGRRILVVEDDVRNVYALSSVFEPKGAQVEIARNGREALEALERSDGGVDLVLMDIMMPEMDGITAMHEIRKRPAWRKLPIIALTAKAMKDDQEKCLRAGANDYIAKPLEVEKLLSLARVWISQ